MTYERRKKFDELFDIVIRDVRDFRADSDCDKACRKTIDMLITAEDIEAVCIHEAGHFIESARLGVIAGFRERDIGYNGPRVIHRPENLGSKFESNPGSIVTPFKADRVKFTVPLFRQVARVAVAGGVYANKFAGRPDDEGTGGDWELYTIYYRIALKTLHEDKDFLIATEMWKCAKKEVAADIEAHPELEQVARNKALEFTNAEYLPFVEYSDLIR